MLYQLPNGKYIEIDSELYFQLTDDDIQDLIALDFGNNTMTLLMILHKRKSL